MKLQPMIGERQKFRDTMSFWARYRIYVILVCGLLFVVGGLVTFMVTASAKEIKDALKEALFIFLALIPGGGLLVGGFILWYRRSRR
jgi:nitrate reductase gamma subunit